MCIRDSSKSPRTTARSVLPRRFRTKGQVRRRQIIALHAAHDCPPKASPLAFEHHQELIAIRSVGEINRPLLAMAVGNPFERIPFNGVKAHIRFATHRRVESMSVDELFARIDLVGSFTETFSGARISTCLLYTSD